MRRFNRRLVVLLAALLTVAFAPLPRPKPPKPGPGPVKDQLKKIQGAWERVSVKEDGAARDVTPGERQVIEGDRLSCVNAAGQVTARWAILLDPSPGPGVMDLRGGPDDLLLVGVYELSGDTLTVAFVVSEDGKGRPTDLKPRKGVCVEVLKRVKKRP